MLGEQIRRIRKQKKITLEALAGDVLTKGMLSLIENNKANPSMESLNYIADRLGVDVSELLEEISTKELRDILEKAETIFNDDTVSDRNLQVIALIEPILEKLTTGYETARLLEIYGRCLLREKMTGWQPYIDRAAMIYDEMNLTARRAAIGLLRSSIKFIEHKYLESLEIFLQERAEIEANHAFIDPMTRLDLDYNEAVTYFAVGNSEAATLAMERAIEFAKKQRVLYRIDDLYRLAAAQGLMTHNEEMREHYLMKLKQYGEFAEDELSLIFYEDLQIMSLVAEKHEYEHAIERIDRYLAKPKMADIFLSGFHLEKAKALYGLGRFQEALSYLEKVNFPEYAHHPFDLATFYVKDSYKALCLAELGNTAEARKHAQTAVKNFANFPPSPFKQFAIETLTKIENSGA